MEIGVRAWATIRLNPHRLKAEGAAPRSFLAEIEERFLHCASRRVRRSEREEKASARSGRNDSVLGLGAKTRRSGEPAARRSAPPYDLAKMLEKNAGRVPALPGSGAGLGLG